VARTTGKLEVVKKSCEELGSPEVTILEADMTKEDDLAKIAQEVSPLSVGMSTTSSHA
jgi:short-subunit dehydrogenase